MCCISTSEDVELCSRDSHTPKSREDKAAVSRGKKSGCRRSPAASTLHSRNWIRHCSNNPGGARGRHTRRFPNHASQSPHRRRARTHRPSSDSVGKGRSGSRTHNPRRSCGHPLAQNRRDRTRPLGRDAESSDDEVSAKGGGGFGIDVDEVASSLLSGSPFKARAPLNMRKGQGGTRDPRAPTGDRPLLNSYRTTSPRGLLSLLHRTASA